MSRRRPRAGDRCRLIQVRGAALGTARLGKPDRRRGLPRPGFLPDGLEVVLEDLPGSRQLGPARRGPEAEETHLDEAPRQDVLEEAPDELLDIERHRRDPALSVLGLEGHALPVEGKDPLIGDRDAEDVPRQVQQRLFAGADMLDLGDPALTPGIMDL